MSEAPARHSAVPDAAIWIDDHERWEEVSRDADGARDGECRLYRSDGSLYMTCHYAGGVRDGAFVMYHRDGRIARQGRYVRGDLEGAVEAFASDAPDDEPL